MNFPADTIQSVKELIIKIENKIQKSIGLTRVAWAEFLKECKSWLKKAQVETITIKGKEYPIQLDNELCSMKLSGTDIGGDDKTDTYNYPRCYNTNHRSWKKAWIALCGKFTEETTMYAACGVIRLNGVGMKSYCSMD